MRKLYWCPNCKENSMTVKSYKKDGKIKRVRFCLNKGCGYRIMLPEFTPHILQFAQTGCEEVYK